jgi:type IV pilus assembly protein PilB
MENELSGSSVALMESTIFAKSFETELKVNANVQIEDPIVKFVNLIINDSVNKLASDVHIEPWDDNYRIRYRIDGILKHISNIENFLASRVCARVKILANLNIVEHRLPQDGRFAFWLESQKYIDCRISVCPTVDGEKIVIRFLNRADSDNLSIDALNMEKRDKEVFLDALSRSEGLILVTGPTGSGKSTTLYTALNYLNKDSLNIISVEDPVEMNISGINQIQVNPQSGLSFVEILRSILRQDPDVIMIGEIRDLETAKIAIQAAETGHLVLASLHTNSAAQTISRLINIGIPAFNVLNSLHLIIAQRLVRKLCEYCKYQKNNFINYVDIESFGLQKFSINSQKISDVSSDFGCNKCHLGYHGRIGIFEVMSVSNSLIKNLSLPNLDIVKLENLACAEGMQLIKNSGLNLVQKGITSYEELRRVVSV